MRQARTYGRVWAPGQTPSALKHGILMFRGPNGSGPAACRAHCIFRVSGNTNPFDASASFLIAY